MVHANARHGLNRRAVLPRRHACRLPIGLLVLLASGGCVSDTTAPSATGRPRARIRPIPSPRLRERGTLRVLQPNDDGAPARVSYLRRRKGLRVAGQPDTGSGKAQQGEGRAIDADSSPVGPTPEELARRHEPHIYRSLPPPKIKGKPLRERRARLLLIQAHPEARYFEEVRAILRNDTDPLSALAAAVLGRMPAPGTERALVEALSDYRPTVRGQALAGLVRLRLPAAAPWCRRLLSRDGNSGVRAIAARGLGMLRDRRSLDLLRRAFARRRAWERIYAAWSLARLDDERGMAHLRRLALADDPQVSPAVMHLLGRLATPTATAILYLGLLSDEARVRAGALAGLRRASKENRQVALAHLSPVQRRRIRQRETVLLYLAGRGGFPTADLSLLTRGSRTDKLLVLRAIERAGELHHVPHAILGCGESSPAVRAAAYKTLLVLARKHRLPGLPGPYAGLGAWQAWWFSLHRLRFCDGRSAVIVFPDGKQHRVVVGTRLHWSSPVVRLHPASGPRDKAWVEVLCGKRVVRITP